MDTSNIYKNPEEMSLEEIKEQLALHSRLYYHKRKDDPNYAEKKRQSSLNSFNKKKLEKYLSENNVDVNELKLKDLEDMKTVKSKKQYECKYSMKNCKVIQRMED